MEAFLQSLALVFASEMGDKTQLLALVLTLRFKKPLAIMAGILCATILNHGIATVVGGWIGAHVSEQVLHVALAAIFFGFALWILVPDKMEDSDVITKNTSNAFITTTVLFFLAEMGDKTQLATLALGAKFRMPVAVTAGTTLGMIAADSFAVFFGERLTKKIPMKAIRIFSAILFAAFGAAILWR